MPKRKQEKIVFTNGCFDILHPGHLDLLKQARSLGTKLIVGLNSDRSVRNLKGDSRPVLDQDSRAEILQALRFVDEVHIFDENTPENLIRKLNPDVLVKGGDWKLNEIVGAKYVTERGGEVHSIPFQRQQSSSQIIEKTEKRELKTATNNLKTDSNLRHFIAKKLKHRQQIFIGREELIYQIVKAISSTITHQKTIGIISTDEKLDNKLADNLKQYIKILELTPTNKTTKKAQKSLIIFIGDSNVLNKKMNLGEKLMLFRDSGSQTVLIGNKLEKKFRSLSDYSLEVSCDNSLILDEVVSTIFNLVSEYISCKQ